MKFIKKYESFDGPPSVSSAITEEELNDIKDLYYDMVDDLNLVDVKSTSEMTLPMTSMFYTLMPYRGKLFEIQINIRTIDQVNSLIDRDNDHFLGKKLKDLLIPYLKRFRQMGYSVSLDDIHMKSDSWNFVTSGIKIKIKK
jgi:hypothetical protein